MVSAIVGVAGLEATHAAILAGKPVGLANKECMVAAGEILTAAARERNVPILPIDSEHNAVHQCMRVGTHARGEDDLADGVGRPVPADCRWSSSQRLRRSKR